MTNLTRKWIRGGIEILIHGGTSALSATIVSWAVDHKDWHFFSLNFWRMFGFQFLTSGGIRFLQWWSNNPLPPDDDAAQISLNPLNKVQSVEAIK